MVDSVAKSTQDTRDLKLIKALAGNNPKVRRKALENLKKWFKLRNSKMPFTELEFMRIWKGLFYTMWMSDKALMQEECAESIAKLMLCLTPKQSLLFLKSAWKTLTNEWFGIDQLRLDKFLMFARRILRKGMEVLNDHDWQLDLVQEFNRVLSETVLNEDNGKHLGLTMHISEIYLEELAKISRGKIGADLVTTLLEPFVVYLSRLNDKRQIFHVEKFLFHHLLRQTDEAVEYHEKFVAWKNLGFPTGSIDCMGKENETENGVEEEQELEDQENEHLDPRAGGVDVVLEQIKFDPTKISELLCSHKFNANKDTTTLARKHLTKLANDFDRLARGDFPLGMKKVELPDNTYSTNLKKAVNRLVKFEHRLSGNKRIRKRRNLKDSIVPSKKKRRVNPENENLSNGFNHSAEYVIKSNRKSIIEQAKSPKRKTSGTWVVEKLENRLEQSPTLSTSKKRSTQFNEKLDAPIKPNIYVSNPIKRLKNKLECKRHSLDSNLLDSVFARAKKKVKIDLKLNQSQEIHEHQAQLLSSPAIPFDATRKPSKPLLKSNFICSPINPFYKKK